MTPTELIACGVGLFVAGYLLRAGLRHTNGSCWSAARKNKRKTTHET